MENLCAKVRNRSVIDWRYRLKVPEEGLLQRPDPNQNSQLKICTAGVGEEEAQRSQLNRWCLTSMSRTPSLRGWEGCFLAGNSQSGLRLKANWDNIRSSHLIWTQPGLQIKLHGWYLLQYYDNSTMESEVILYFMLS